MLTAMVERMVEPRPRTARKFGKLRLVPRSTEPQLHQADTVDALLTRVATGDSDAFSGLYDATAPRLLGLITRILVDRAQSEEVAQEVFLEIWQMASRFDSEKGSAISWMLRIAHRRAVDRVRASQSDRDRDVRIGIRDTVTGYDSVAESAETRIESEKVKDALGRLTDLQRQAVTLTYYGGYTQRELADILKIPLGTVKTRVRDGMTRLRDELGVAS